MTRVLFVVTGAREWTLADGTTHPTGFWAEELVAAHRVLVAAGCDLTIAVPGGVRPQADPASLLPEFNGGDEAVVAELRAAVDGLADQLAAPTALEDVEPGAHDVVFVPGGHGPMEDLAASPAMGRLLVAALDAGAIVATVCHASAALLSADREDGSWAFAGYRMTGFSNEEEQAVGLADRAAWLLEDRLRERGGEVETGPAFAPHLVADRQLHTGQNPASSGPLAEQVLAAVPA